MSDERSPFVAWTGTGTRFDKPVDVRVTLIPNEATDKTCNWDPVYEWRDTDSMGAPCWVQIDPATFDEDCDLEAEVQRMAIVALGLQTRSQATLKVGPP